MTKDPNRNNTAYSGLEIAVIGMAGQFPGAASIDEFWQNLTRGVESVSFYTSEELTDAGVQPHLVRNPQYVPAGLKLDQKEYFDASFFGYLPEEARLMDPQMRMFHRCVHDALEDAGCNPDTYPGMIGLYAGAGANFDWEAFGVISGSESTIDGFTMGQLVNRDYVAARVAYRLNLKGPALAIQTACSTSLVAIHTACRALLTGDTHIALAGGVSLTSSSCSGYLYRDGMILSPDGHVRAFDARAAGIVSGEGAAVVVLKKMKNALADHDHIYALIKGSAVNNDGSRKVGFSAPSVDGQAETLRMAFKMSRVSPETVGFIETHGTGTPLGDLIEFQALTQVFGTQSANRCALGAVKTNVGHLGSAAGVTGFIKAVLALNHRVIPPTLHFETPNPQIHLDKSPFYINTGLRQWQPQEGPLRAGVSSFGIGGTNAHVVLEQAPPQEAATPGRPHCLWTFSAHTPAALDRMTRNLGTFLATHPETSIHDAAYTLQLGRKHLTHRRMVVGTDSRQLADILTDPASTRLKSFTPTHKSPLIVFMFPGLGSQHHLMGQDLNRHEPLFHQQLQHCQTIADTIYRSYPSYPSQKSPQPQLTLFAHSYALAKLLISWGITPGAMIGYSFGEYVAACISGVLSLEDAIKTIIERSQLLNDAPAGVMLSVPLTSDQLMPMLDHTVTLAIDNGASCIVSGLEEDIQRLEQQMKSQRHICMRVDNPFPMHSPLMEPVARKLSSFLRTCRLNAPVIPYISNLTGTWISDEEACDPDYFARHWQHRVRFSEGLKELMTKDHVVFLEVGSGKSLCNIVRQLSPGPHHHVLDLQPGQEEPQQQQYRLIDRLGRLWLYGVDIQWQEFYSNRQRRKVSLPGYPYEPISFPVDADAVKMVTQQMKSNRFTREADPANWFFIPTWKRTHLIQQEKAPCYAHTLVFLQPGTPAHQWWETIDIEPKGTPIITVVPGTAFQQQSSHSYTLRPGYPEDYQNLFQSLSQNSTLPDRIIHLWNFTGHNEPSQILPEVAQVRQQGYDSLLDIARALDHISPAPSVDIYVLADRLSDIDGSETLSPAKAMLLGAVTTIPREYTNLRCRCIDLNLDQWKKSPGEEWLRSLNRELLAPRAASIVALRGSRRWTPSLDTVPFVAPESSPGLLVEGATYLITGGMGGMGLAFANFLAKQYRAHLILTGRKPLTAAQQEQLGQLKQGGGRIRYIQADVSDMTQLTEQLTEAEHLMGNLQGVFHTAGIADYAGVIRNRTAHQCRAVFAAKIYGTVNLDNYLSSRENPPRFVVLCSSLASLLSPFGQVAYTAANRFQDAFAHFKTQSPGATWYVSINWDTWQQVGMAKDEDHPLGIYPQEGIDILCRILNQDVPQVAVSTVDLEAVLNFYNAPPGQLAEHLLQQETVTAVALDRPQLTNPYVAPITGMEKRLAELWQRFFGLKQVGIADDFFELGGDSLKAMTMAALIHKTFDVELQLADFFNAPTIQEMALRMGSGETGTFVAVPKAPSMEYYPLSAGQKRLYFLYRLEPQSTGYNMTEALTLTGSLDRQKTEQAVRHLIARHESLRTSFIEIDNRPVQRIHEPEEVSFSIRYHDASQEPDASVGDFIRPYDLSSAPLMRIGLIRQDSQRWVLIVDMHHIVSDGVSQQLLVDDFLTLYRGEESEFHRLLPPLPLQYKDYACWQTQILEDNSPGSLIPSQRLYWTQRLKDHLPVLQLPYDFPRPVIQSFDGGTVSFQLDPHRTAGLKQLAQSSNATLYMTLLAVYSVLLARLSHQQDLVVGTPVAGRNHADLHHVIGMFVNTLAIRVSPQADLTFDRYLSMVKEETVAAFRNRDYPFETLVEDLSTHRDISRNPLFDAAFVMQNTRLDAAKPQEHDAGFQVEAYDYGNRVAKFDLTLDAVETPDYIHLGMEYCTGLFKEETILRFIGYFERLVDAFIHDPAQGIHRVSMITEQEKQWLLKQFNDTGADYPQDKTLDGLFREQVLRTPHHVAVVDRTDGTYATYSGLDRQAGEIAAGLQEQGVAGGIVALLMTPGIHMIASILAVLKSRAAYLPIDPNYPKQRIDYMLKDSGATVCLDDLNHRGHRAHREEKKNPAQRDSVPSVSSVVQKSPGNASYIIYTSGTTGKPKGVVIQHRNVVRLLFNSKFQFQFSQDDTWTLFHSYCFDFSVWEMYGALLRGGRLIIVPPALKPDPAALVRLVSQENVTILNQTPSAFYTFSAEALKTDLPFSLRYIIFGGDALQPARLNQWHHRYPHIKLINMYGITETTVHVTYKEIRQKEIDSGTSTIGKPIPTLTVWVLGWGMALQPPGVPGQCGVGGDGVGRGYLNRPQLTAQKFIPDPYSPGQRLYLSGDLVKLDHEGDLEYLGRIDKQVQIRGHRVEPGEVVAALTGHQSIRDAVLLPVERDGGHISLCAYIVMHSGTSAAPSIQQLNDYLSTLLPDYMIPGHYVPIQTIPLTANGKIDRRALLEMAGTLESGNSFVPPSNHTETQIVETWKKLLGLEQIGINDNFFDIGGNSLLVVQVVGELNRLLDREIAIMDIFMYPTAAQLARHMEASPSAPAPEIKIDRSDALQKARKTRGKQAKKRKLMDSSS